MNPQKAVLRTAASTVSPHGQPYRPNSRAIKQERPGVVKNIALFAKKSKQVFNVGVKPVLFAALDYSVSVFKDFWRYNFGDPRSTYLNAIYSFIRIVKGFGKFLLWCYRLPLRIYRLTIR